MIAMIAGIIVFPILLFPTMKTVFLDLSLIH